jgi:hypothetical protein
MPVVTHSGNLVLVLGWWLRPSKLLPLRPGLEWWRRRQAVSSGFSGIVSLFIVLIPDYEYITEYPIERAPKNGPPWGPNCVATLLRSKADGPYERVPSNYERSSSFEVRGSWEYSACYLKDSNGKE